MKSKKWVVNSLYLIIAILAFSQSVLKCNDSMWIAAWIAPVFFLRFMRESKWVFAVIAGFILLQAAHLIGSLPLFGLYSSTASMSNPPAKTAKRLNKNFSS